MKITKIIAAAAAIAFTLTALASCGSTDSSSQTESKTDSVSSETENTSSEERLIPDEKKPPETDAEWHQAMLETSLTGLYDVSLLKEKIAKARNGEKVTLAYIGGSITEGLTAGDDLCYAKLSYEGFKKRFGADNAEYVNAGISGTPSKLGNLRLQRDVLSKSPDICFVEFAVNDSSDEDCQAAYESIVRDLTENGVAVVLLFSVTEADYSAQDYMKKIGQYYNLPMISYCDALRYMFENGRMTWKDFSDDQSHPNEAGHALVAEMIDYFFEQADAVTPNKFPYPTEPMSMLVQQNMTLLENTDIEPVSLGSWKEGSTIAHFTKGWTYEPDTGNEPLVFKFKGRFAHLVYKEVKSGKFGTLHVKVTCDGELYDETDIKTVTKEGWGNPQNALLGMQVNEKEYVVEISMAEGSESMKGEVLAVAHN
ncbi:MAG: SGNH/GDSL hydrolase family protein [Ruminococcus sp.]|nr:SGNH/GDSL hydrolase family protein [Ruminococcus sp.]